jgi:hypothetical protein
MKRKKTLVQNAATIQQQKDFLSSIAFGSLTLSELERYGHYYETTGPAPFDAVVAGNTAYLVPRKKLEENAEQVEALNLEIIPLMVKDSSITGPDKAPEYKAFISTQLLMAVILGANIDISRATDNYQHCPGLQDSITNAEQPSNKIYILLASIFADRVECCSREVILNPETE